MQHSFLLSLLLVVTTASEIQIQLKGSQLAKEKSLPHAECGLSRVKHHSDSRHSLPGIYGGEKAKPGEFPWMALLGYSVHRGVYEFECGGTLITDRYVVTAAHCLYSHRKGDGVKVRLGELNLNPRVKDDARDYDVEHIVIHENYDPESLTNDIGLVRLRRTVTFTDFIRPICLPPLKLRTKSFYSEKCTAAGWGDTEKGYDSSKLLKVDLPVVNQDYCKVQVENKLPEVVVDERVICAGMEGKDSCRGDSGGPLMWTSKDEEVKKWYLIGVVSYGYKCGIRGYPGVYTRVSHFMPWIMDHIEV